MTGFSPSPPWVDSFQSRQYRLESPGPVVGGEFFEVAPPGGDVLDYVASYLRRIAGQGRPAPL